MQQIRVRTYEGLGAKPVIRIVPPKVGSKAALIKIGASRKEGVGDVVADAMAVMTVKSTIVPWPELVQ